MNYATFEQVGPNTCTIDIPLMIIVHDLGGSSPPCPYDTTASLARPEIQQGCSRIDPILQGKEGFDDPYLLQVDSMNSH